MRTVVMLMTLGTLAAACGSRSQPPTAADTPPPATIGQFVWQDLMTDDIEASRRFYSELLGWEFEDTSRFGHRYLLARTVLGYIGGIAEVEPHSSGRPVSQWLSYVRVSDVSGAAADVIGRGGLVLVEPLELGAGSVAVVTDPQGGLIGLTDVEHGLPSRDPRVAPSGTFFWRDYLARDVEDAREFYQAMTGLDTEQQERVDGQLHYVLRRQRALAGVVPIVPDHIAPHWLPYLRVDDPVLLARQVERLGGRVLLPPRADTRNGSLAIVADPRGAAVALQKYPF